MLVELDAAGRACRADVWEAEQLEQAQARFAQLAASALAPTIPSSPRPARFDGALDRRTERFPNAASRANERFAAAWSAGDWATIEALHAPTCQLADHRRLMQMRLAGRIQPGAPAPALRRAAESLEDDASGDAR